MDTMTRSKIFARWLLSLFVLLAPALVSAQTFDPEYLIVELADGYSIETVNSQFGTSTARYLSRIDIYLLNVDLGVDLDSLASEIVGLTEVISCHPNYTVSPLQAVQGSLPISDLSERSEYVDQAAIEQLDLDGVHGLSRGAGVKIALLDGGVNYDHEALADVTFSGFDLVDNDADAFDEPGGVNSGHGTFVAGIIHLTAPDAEIWAYRVTDTAGESDGYLVAEAIMLAVDEGCRIISLSMVMSSHHMAISRAIKYARGYGVLVVVAAGNGPTNPPLYPADDSRALAVAAVDSNGVLADFSGVGSHIDICAPGVNICSPYLDTSYARWSGTSFATPFVAGQAALILSYNPDLSSSQIFHSIILTGSSVDTQNPGFEGRLGGGLVDLTNSLLYDPVVCGDVDGDHELGFSDLIHLLDYVTNLQSDPPDFPMTASDMDSHSGLDAGDIVYLREHMFVGGPAPVTCP